MYKARLETVHDNKTERTFTYMWHIREDDNIDAEILSSCTILNRGLTLPQCMERTLVAGPNSTMVSSAGYYIDLHMKKVAVDCFAECLKGRRSSIFLCPDGHHVILTRKLRDDPSYSTIELWEIGGTFPLHATSISSGTGFALFPSATGSYLVIARKVNLKWITSPRALVLELETGAEWTLAEEQNYEQNLKDPTYFFGNKEQVEVLTCWRPLVDVGVGSVWRFIEGDWVRTIRFTLDGWSRPLQFDADDSKLICWSDTRGVSFIDTDRSESPTIIQAIKPLDYWRLQKSTRRARLRWTKSHLSCFHQEVFEINDKFAVSLCSLKINGLLITS